ncbi:MAG TPA: hypothetical protein VN247_08495 [Arenimonas sp.]|nr:hypothetical protein [Arenimonas sp.]
MCDGGVDADQLPNGYGEFGLSPNNPIPCQSLLGQRMYLDRLRTANNTKVIYRRIGSFFSDVCKYPIDGYALLDTKGNTLETIYISAYQKRNSCKSPKNFYLANNLYS